MASSAAYERFQDVHQLTAEFEGGWSNHKSDPGGKTMYGVTQRVYHAWLRKKHKKTKPVRNITKKEALQIYFANYWQPTAVKYKLVPGVDRVVYDGAVNSGVGRAVKWLKQASGSEDHSVTVKRFCAARLRFMRSLRIWKVFGRGWARRVAAMEARGVAEALTGMNRSAAVKQAVLVSDAADAKKQSDKAKSQALAPATAGAGSGGAVVASGDFVTSLILATILLACLAVVLYLIAKSHTDKARAEAYEQEAANQ